MTQNPRVVSSETKAAEALNVMKLPPSISFLPVVGHDKKLLGLVSLHDLIAAGL